jgi:hypothetical protein
MSEARADMSSVADLPGAVELQNRLAGLQESLQKALPNYDGHLFTIHQMLQKNSDLVHMLTDEQIGLIVAGLVAKTNTVILSEASKKGAASKALRATTVNDI